MPQPLQHPHDRLACLRKQRVVVTRDKQRNSQTLPPVPGASPESAALIRGPFCLESLSAFIGGRPKPSLSTLVQ
jgi:hypothetical protein